MTAPDPARTAGVEAVRRWSDALDTLASVGRFKGEITLVPEDQFVVDPQSGIAYVTQNVWNRLLTLVPPTPNTEPSDG